MRRRGKRYLLAISAQTNQPTDQQERHAGKSEKLYGFSSPGSGTITNQHVSTDMRACMKASNIVSLSGIAFFFVHISLLHDVSGYIPTRTIPSTYVYVWTLENSTEHFANLQLQNPSIVSVSELNNIRTSTAFEAKICELLGQDESMNGRRWRCQTAWPQASSERKRPA